MNVSQLAKEYIYWPEITNNYQKNFDFSKTKVKDLIPMINDILSEKDNSIEDAILKFYSLNEALGLMRKKEQDILDEKSISLYEQYQAEIETLSKKLFAYLFIISSMEARYTEDKEIYNEIENEIFDEYEYKGNSKSAEQIIAIIQKQFKKQMKANYNNRLDKLKFDSFFKVHKVVTQLSEIDRESKRKTIQTFFNTLINKEIPDITIGEYLNSLRVIFNEGPFEEDYGGESWGSIVEHALKFVNGQLNSEVFIDQTFSLEHNTGHIFNKNIIFTEPQVVSVDLTLLEDSINTEYTEFHLHQLLLNLQHSGQLNTFLLYDFKSDINYLKKLLKNISDNENDNEDEIFNKTEENNKNKYTTKLELIPVDLLKQIKSVYSNHVYLDTDDEDNHFSYYNLFIESAEQGINFLEQLQEIQNKLTHNNKDIIKTHNNLNLDTPPLNISEFFDCLTLNSQYGDEEVIIADAHTEFHNFLKNINTLQKKKQIKTKSTKFIFEYLNTNAITETQLNKTLLGNKAFGLAQMEQAGLPVPKSFVLPTTNATSITINPEKWDKALNKNIHNMLVSVTLDNGNPKLCSVRSGSSISMPGMMDTILNVGIDDTNYEYFCEKMGKSVTDECVKKFMTLFIKSLTGEQVSFTKSLPFSLKEFKDILKKHNISHDESKNFPLSSEAQYKLCIKSVFNSWNSERATAYRNHHNIPHDIGTAAIVQQMVFGNLNLQSCTGVVFSRDCINGKKGIIGEFLPKAQGEDVVSGAVTPLNISELQNFNPTIYKQLVGICEKLEKETGDIQDIEFTIEDGKLYILQKRKAVCSSVAQIKLNNELLSNNLITKEEYINNLKVEHLIPKDEINNKETSEIYKGLVGNPGVMRGIIIQSERDFNTFSSLYNILKTSKDNKNIGWIFYSNETSPEHAPLMLKTDAFLTKNGGFTSHAAILARSWDKPCVVGIGQHANLKSGDILTIDANNGHIYSGVLPLKRQSKKDTNHIVNQVLDFYNVDVQQLDVQHISELTNDINSKKTWMEEYTSKPVILKNKINHDKFLSISNKVALMLLKNKQKNKQNTI